MWLGTGTLESWLVILLVRVLMFQLFVLMTLPYFIYCSLGSIHFTLPHFKGVFCASETDLFVISQGTILFHYSHITIICSTISQWMGNTLVSSSLLLRFKSQLTKYNCRESVTLYQFRSRSHISGRALRSVQKKASRMVKAFNVILDKDLLQELGRRQRGTGELSSSI